MATGLSPWTVGHGAATAFTRHQAQTFCREVLESQTYRDNLKLRAETGTLAPAMESMLWAYAYGKPVEHVEVKQVQDFSSLSLEELQEQAKQMLDALDEAKQIAEAIPGEFLKEDVA